MRVNYRITNSLVLATYVLLVTSELINPHERAVTLPSETVATRRVMVRARKA